MCRGSRPRIKTNFETHGPVHCPWSELICATPKLLLAYIHLTMMPKERMNGNTDHLQLISGEPIHGGYKPVLQLIINLLKI